MTVNRPQRPPIRFESDLTIEVPLPSRKNDPVQPISPWNPRLSECLSLCVGAWCIYRGVTNRNMESGVGGIALVFYATIMMRDSTRVARLEDSHKRKIAKLKRESLDTQKELSKSLTEARASHESAQAQLQNHLTATKTELRETQNYLTATEERLLKIQRYLRATERRQLETQEALIKQQTETAHYQAHARELRLEYENLKAQLSEIQDRKEKEDQEKEQPPGTGKTNNTTSRLQGLVSSLFYRK